jgi:hypothetical protein
MVHTARQLLTDRPLLLLLLLLPCQAPAASWARASCVSRAGGWLSRQKGFGGNWVADVVALQLCYNDFVDLVLCHFAGVGCFQLVHKLLELLWHKRRETQVGSNYDEESVPTAAKQGHVAV